MAGQWRRAPKTKQSVLSLEELEKRLYKLVGTPVNLTKKPRTDGSNIRKMIEEILHDRLDNALEETQYEVLPPKSKGVPRLLLELIDTYLVTSGNTYNLQVWNRQPNSGSALVRYTNGEVITCQDIRFVLVKVDMENEFIESIIILTPEYIEKRFGPFGVPTIKQQLLISETKRKEIVDSPTHFFLGDDTPRIKKLEAKNVIPTKASHEAPDAGEIMPINEIYQKIASNIIGYHLAPSDTKTRGQSLERLVIDLLGYTTNSKLVGGYPDIPNQVLEVKVQDKQTIDLGKYSPQVKEAIPDLLSLSSEDVRYLIALTNPKTHVIEGVVLCSGKDLNTIATYVSDKSYKCQRSIPMLFFDDYIGDCVVNPPEE